VDASRILTKLYFMVYKGQRWRAALRALDVPARRMMCVTDFRAGLRSHWKPVMLVFYLQFPSDSSKAQAR